MGRRKVFIPLVTVCSCGNFDDDANLQCEGKPYESRVVLSSEIHSLGYEIECETRALSAKSVIHPTMGRGHSNLCEAAFNILPRFRAKSLAVHHLLVHHPLLLGTHHEL